jgi:hypothetical protein
MSHGPPRPAPRLRAVRRLASTRQPPARPRQRLGAPPRWPSGRDRPPRTRRRPHAPRTWEPERAWRHSAPRRRCKPRRRTPRPLPCPPPPRHHDLRPWSWVPAGSSLRPRRRERAPAATPTRPRRHPFPWHQVEWSSRIVVPPAGRRQRASTRRPLNARTPGPVVRATSSPLSALRTPLRIRLHSRAWGSASTFPRRSDRPAPRSRPPSRHRRGRATRGQSRPVRCASSQVRPQLTRCPHRVSKGWRASR